MKTYRLELSFDDGTSEEVEEDRYYDYLRTIEDARREADHLFDTTPNIVEIGIFEVEVVHRVTEIETVFPFRTVLG